MRILISKQHWSLLLLSLALVFIAYSNSFQASWHLDDEPNILTNSKLHFTKLSLQSFKNSLTANPSSPLASTKLYRPIPCFTLALNWYWSQDNVFGYHVINFFIHIFTTWFLFLTLRLILQTHYKKSTNSQFITTAALLGALFWSLAPIQTQAVTYIIQRMASMAAMFTIIAIYAYLKGRTATTKNRAGWLALCLFSFFAALASKENTILLPASLALIEITFFQQRITTRQIALFSLAGVLVLLSGLIFVRFGMGIHPFNFLDSYGHRSFTFTERILTEPRIVWMYISQTLIPLADRLSIKHDFTLSTSLFSPWTTLPAILTIFFLIALSIRFLKKYPLITFPVLFFFLNHLVESTVIPLELIFEHRNYLPSFFLFLPLGILISRAMYGPGRFSPAGRVAVALCASLFLMISGYATYARNAVWANEGTLWTDAITKAPKSPRVAHNLGRWYRGYGRYKQAHYYFQSALNNAEHAASPKMTTLSALNGLASVSYMLGKPEQALHYFNQCLSIDKTHEACLKNRALAYLQLGLPEKAETDLLQLVKTYPTPTEYHYLTALASFQAGDLQTAQTHIGKIAANSLEDFKVMYLAGLILARQQVYLNSIFFLKQAQRVSPDDIGTQLIIASVYILTDNLTPAKENIKNLFNTHAMPEIINGVNNLIRFGLDEKTIRSIQNEFKILIERQPDTSLQNE